MGKEAGGSSINRLRPYQREVAAAVLDSVLGGKGLTFSVEIARQGGKNELSAQLELLLLTLFMGRSKNMVKCSPSFKPQTVISMVRLKDRLNDAGFGDIWAAELGYIIRLGCARAVFLSAGEQANVVGTTAHILLEIDESQDVNKEKYNKEFRPMGATSNVTTVHYGTTWDDSTLLEEIKQTNLEMEKRDGIRRHFRYDWQEVARHNPGYRAYVEAEREQLEKEHPYFLTQYRLLPVHGGGGFFDRRQIAGLAGEHPRQYRRSPGGEYIAGIDLAGEAEQGEEERLRMVQHRRDSTVITIGELDRGSGVDRRQPGIRVVEHYRWTGRKHSELYREMVDIVKGLWRGRRVVVDATGIGEPVASFLGQALGSRVVPFKFTAQSKSRLGFNLLAAVNSGRLKVYAADGSPEYRELFYEMERARSRYRPNRTLDFYVDPAEGHDDFLMSLALMVEAAGHHSPRSAKGRTLDY